MKRILLPIALLALTTTTFAQLNAKVSISRKAQAPPTPSVSLSCTPPATGATPTGYNFYRATVSGGPYSLLTASNPPTNCAYTDNTVAFSTTYYYVATSLNGSYESGYSNQATAVVPQNPQPNPPTNLTVVSIVAGKVNLQWKSPAAQAGVVVESYNIMRGLQPTLPSPNVIGNTPNTSFSDPGCKPAWKVCYYEITAVVVMNGKKTISGPSNIVAAQI